jgi:hypothetical protein
MGRENDSSSKKNIVSLRRIGFYFTVLAFFGPAFALINWVPPSYPRFQIWGMLWMFYYSIDFGGWHLDFFRIILPCTVDQIYTSSTCICISDV